MAAQTDKWRRILSRVLIAGSSVGLAASLALTHDKIQVLKNPAYDPSCNLNPILSCGSVMNTEQASLLGMPNTVFGIAAYAALLTVGVALLAGLKAQKWFWLAVQAGVTGAIVFVHYLFFQGVFRINAICPWCFAVWMATIPIFWYTTVYNLQAKNIVMRGKAGHWLGRKAVAHHDVVLIVWYLVILSILIQHFWYYWETLI